MYEYTDKIIRYLTKKFIGAFGRAKSLLAPMDELNVISFSQDLYDQLEEITEEKYLVLANNAYKYGAKEAETLGFRKKKKRTKCDESWLDVILAEYDPVTLYVFRHEVERKESRFAEGVAASKLNKPQNRLPLTTSQVVDRALRLWTGMIKQYAITVTDKATLTAYKDYGVKKVMWLTEADDRRCEDCLLLDHKVFSIDEIPPKPHINCRCRVVPYKGDTK